MVPIKRASVGTTENGAERHPIHRDDKETIALCTFVYAGVGCSEGWKYCALVELQNPWLDRRTELAE
jgi:hypothetical protein